MTTEAERVTHHDDEIEHYRARVDAIPDLRRAFLHRIIGPAGSTPFATDREQHVAQFVADAILSALVDIDNHLSHPMLLAIHDERRRRQSAATRAERSR